jgi:hypothetical protein
MWRLMPAASRRWWAAARVRVPGLVDTALNRFGAGVGGCLQCGPYPSATPQHVHRLLSRYQSNYREMLQP